MKGIEPVGVFFDKEEDGLITYSDLGDLGDLGDWFRADTIFGETCLLFCYSNTAQRKITLSILRFVCSTNTVMFNNDTIALPKISYAVHPPLYPFPFFLFFSLVLNTPTSSNKL